MRHRSGVAPALAVPCGRAHQALADRDRELAPDVAGALALEGGRELGERVRGIELRLQLARIEPPRELGEVSRAPTSIAQRRAENSARAMPVTSPSDGSSVM